MDWAMGSRSGSRRTLDPDSDWDSVEDGAEVAANTDALNPDSDGDGLWDDVDPWPLEHDYDRDGLRDGDEFVADVDGLRLELEDYSPSDKEPVLPPELANDTIEPSLEQVTFGFAGWLGADRQHRSTLSLLHLCVVRSAGPTIGRQWAPNSPSGKATRLS